MDFSVCNQCGKEIEGKGIQFRSKCFCCDECCDIFEENLVAVDEPGFDDLENDSLEEMDDETDDEGLGYDIDPTEEKTRDPLGDDDEFEIDPDDF